MESKEVKGKGKNK